MLKNIISLLCCLFLLVSLMGCSLNTADSVRTEFDTKAQSSMPESTFIAENESYRLEYDSKNMGVILTDMKTGEKWGSTPDSDEEELDELGMPKKRHPQVESILAVKYINFETNVENTVLSYTGAVQNGRVRCATAKDSMLLEFYFDEAGFMIPVEYKLHEDCVEIYVNTKNIQEGQNHIIQISLAPFWCSVKNNSSDTYLFYPSGSGALVDTSERSQQGISYSQQVFGNDLCIEQNELTSTEKNVSLPVYGAKMGEKATVAIIEEGVDSALIDVKAGSTALGYTSVYATFQMRGHTFYKKNILSSAGTNNGETVSTVYSKDMIDTPISVKFYPLLAENANYSGMANVYRSYLLEHSDMPTESTDTVLNLTLLGGAMITKSFFGIPYKTIYPATTLEEAQEIISDISSNVDLPFNVNLKGFGSTGVNIGEIGGGFKLNGKLGDTAEIQAIYKLCKKNDVNLYIDFDISRYSASSNGFSTFFDSSFSAGGQRTNRYLYNLAVRSQQENTGYFLLSPKHMFEATEKLIKKTADWSFDGISLETVSYTSYSDFRDKGSSEFYSKSGYSKTVQKAIKEIKGNKKKFLSTGASSYAAVLSDVIYDAPIESSGEYIFTNDIPFYQIVFKGHIPMAIESINLSDNADNAILKAVESGCGLNYTLINNWDNSLIDVNSNMFFNSLYKDIKKDLIKSTNELSRYYEKISEAHIVSHTIIENGVRKTVFDNGVEVYVNYNDNAVKVGGHKIEAHNYIALEKPI